MTALSSGSIVVTMQNGLVTNIWAIVDVTTYLASVSNIQRASTLINAAADGLVRMSLRPFSPPDCEFAVELHS